MSKPSLKIRSLKEESLTKKLAISFFFMSLIPILFLMYLIKIVGYEHLLTKLPYIRWTIFLLVCLASVLFVFLRYHIHSLASIINMAQGIVTSGDYTKKIEIDEEAEIGQLAKSFNKITSELENKIKELQESKDVIQSIFKKIGKALTSTEGIDQLLELILETVTKAVFAESSCIMILDGKGNELKIKVSYGLDENVVSKISRKLGEGIIGLSAKEKRTIISSYTDEPQKRGLDKIQLYHKNVIAAPLLYKEENLGIMAIFDKKSAATFKEDDEILITNVAAQAAVAIANANLNEDAETTYIETISALAIAVEAKDPYSRGHLDRVSRLVVDFAKHLNSSERTIEILKDGANLHDLGKIGIRDEILCKAGPLTKEEQKELEKHAIIGENIMRPISKLAPLCDMVRYHQEWWDGTGYPDGLKGEEIPLTARILKIVDAFDAMSTDRPYRKALTKEQIKQEFKKNSGTEFDPKLVEKFLEII